MRHLSLAVVGADHPNKKGPARRFEIALCVPGESVNLIPEPKNPADPRAIAVYSARSIQIGYIRAERAQFIGNALSRDGVRAIFQSPATWGAVIRAHLDGSEPTLPTTDDSPSLRKIDEAWWPDHDPGWD